MSDTNYFYGHGRAYGGVRTSAGLVSNYDLDFTEVESLSLNFAADMVEHESKRESIASVDLRFARKIAGTGTLIFNVHNTTMLALGFWGTPGTVAGGAFTAISFPTGLVVGGRYPIPGNRRNITSLVLIDSTGSPVTLTLGTHYSADLHAGVITILALTGPTVVQPIIAAGSEGAGVSVGGLTQRIYERRLLYSGINLADNDKRCSVDLYKVQFDPAKDLQLINSGNEVNKYELGFSILKDTTVDPANANGQYFLYKEVNE
jgi:hypothetical protein